MAKKGNNLIKLAKDNKISVSKKEEETIISSEDLKAKVISPEEERDLKAKAKVEELLQDVKLTTEKKEEELLEVDEEPKGIEWLEEQIQLLSNANENLKSELTLAKDDYIRIFEENQRLKDGVGDGAVKLKLIELFNEIQNNHIQLGTDPISGIGNFRIYCPGFLNRLILFFPFLENMRKF
jgi:hypothetical protein